MWCRGWGVDVVSDAFKFRPWQEVSWSNCLIFPLSISTGLLLCTLIIGRVGNYLSSSLSFAKSFSMTCKRSKLEIDIWICHCNPTTNQSPVKNRTPSQGTWDYHCLCPKLTFIARDSQSTKLAKTLYRMCKNIVYFQNTCAYWPFVLLHKCLT